MPPSWRDVAPGATIGAVWRELAGEFPELVPYERSISSAVNADYARMDDVVRDGDEIAFLPPVSGGNGAQRSPYGPLTKSLGAQGCGPARN